MRAEVARTLAEGQRPEPGTRNRTVKQGQIGWCSEGKNSEHPDADECSRQIVPSHTPEGARRPGQQFCYAAGSLLNEGRSAGTPDRVATSDVVKHDGSCDFVLYDAEAHYWEDVALFDSKLGEYGEDLGSWLYFHKWPPSRGSVEAILLRREIPWHFPPPGSWA